MARFVPSLLAALLVGAATAQDKPAELAEVTEARLQAAYADAIAACSKAFGGPLDPAVPLRLVDAKEVAAIVARENLPIVRLREPDEAKAAAEAELLGKQLAATVYAKYAWSERSFVVVAKSWQAFAKTLELPTLVGDDGLRAVMVHELCHAYDDRKFDLAARLQKATSVEATQAFNAVFEGHAQLQTRRVCAQNGWTAGFEAMREAVGRLAPETAKAGEAAMMLARSAAAASRFAYHDGEDFVAAVLKADPERGAQRIFHEPPVDQESVLRPQWYLDPASRPAALYDPEPALDRAAAWLGEGAWRTARVNTTGKQIASGLTLLPQDDVDAFVASLRNSRMLQAMPKKNPRSKLAIVAVMEFDSDAGAERWIATTQRLSDLKDEAMKTGVTRILSSRTTPIAEDGSAGFLVDKRMQSGKLEFDVATIDVRRGRVVVETIFSGEPPAADEHQKLVRELLDAVQPKR
jgi:hypothetical protein